MFEYWMLVICLRGTVSVARAGVEKAEPAEEEGEEEVRVWWDPRRMYYISFVFSKLIHFLFGDLECGLAALWRGHDFKLDLLF